MVKYTPMILDTSIEASRVQSEAHRALGGPRRVQIACRMSESVRALCRHRIRAKHPEFDDAAVNDWLIWELYGIRRQRR